MIPTGETLLAMTAHSVALDEQNNVVYISGGYDGSVGLSIIWSLNTINCSDFNLFN